MSNKKEKKDTLKNTSRTKKTPMLKLDNGKKIPGRIVYEKDNNDCFRTDQIDINKIRVSEKSLFNKQHNSYKYYVAYEHNDKYIPLRIIMKDLVGYYNVYKDGDDNNGGEKRMNFKINDEHSDKIYQALENIFEDIDKKLDIALNGITFEKKGESYFKTKVTDERCFKENIKSNPILKEGKVITKENDANFIPKENVMYTCRVLLQIQSVFFKIKDKDDNIIYYPQLLLQQCVCKRFINNIIFHPGLEFTDTEPESESESESEEEINENTVLDE